MASLQWSHHDGFIPMMTSSQQQKHLYNGVIVKVPSSWHCHNGVVMMVSSPS